MTTEERLAALETKAQAHQVLIGFLILECSPEHRARIANALRDQIEKRQKVTPLRGQFAVPTDALEHALDLLR